MKSKYNCIHYNKFFLSDILLNGNTVQWYTQPNQNLYFKSLYTYSTAASSFIIFWVLSTQQLAKQQTILYVSSRSNSRISTVFIFELENRPDVVVSSIFETDVTYFIRSSPFRCVDNSHFSLSGTTFNRKKTAHKFYQTSKPKGILNADSKYNKETWLQFVSWFQFCIYRVNIKQ